MKAIKVTTADGKTITAGYKDANWISVEYRYSPRHNVTQYHVSAMVFGADDGEWYHEWTPSKQSSPVIKLEVVDSDIVDPPLRNRPGTHRWINETESEPSCSFCGKVQSEVETLITGGRANICDQCVELCNGTLSGNYKDDI